VIVTGAGVKIYQDVSFGNCCNQSFEVELAQNQHPRVLEKVTVQSCIKTVVFVIARSVLCDEAIPRRSIWPDKWEIASPENGSQ